MCKRGLTKSQLAEITTADFFTNTKVGPDHEHISVPDFFMGGSLFQWLKNSCSSDRGILENLETRFSIRLYPKYLSPDSWGAGLGLPNIELRFIISDYYLYSILQLISRNNLILKTKTLVFVTCF